MSVRAECLDQHGFTSLEEAKTEIEAWRRDYNKQRPHSSLGNLTLAEFLACWQHQQNQKKRPAHPPNELSPEGRSLFTAI